MGALHLSVDNFEQEVLQSQIPVLVDFWADWCGPCKMIAPLIDELAQELSDVKICKVNVDEAGDIAMKYRIMSIPTLVLFKGGEKVAVSVGAKSKAELLDFIHNNQ